MADGIAPSRIFSSQHLFTGEESSTIREIPMAERGMHVRLSDHYHGSFFVNSRYHARTKLIRV